MCSWKLKEKALPVEMRKRKPYFYNQIIKPQNYNQF